jgi:pre-mRNA-splicing factor CWC26
MGEGSGATRGTGEAKAGIGEAENTGFARYADDKDLNEELKAQDRWNDPAAAFLTVSNFSFSALIQLVGI